MHTLQDLNIVAITHYKMTHGDADGSQQVS